MNTVPGQSGLFADGDRALRITPANPAELDVGLLFEYRHKFRDDVHGRVLLNSLERDVVDTPEFQRLFRIGQLGFVDLVFQTANHTRGAHSIGTCHVVGLLMDHLVRNHVTSADETQRSTLKSGFPRCERVLIRLGGLLHDISHGPYSHDIEKKKHVIYKDSGQEKLVSRSAYGAYDKHDSFDKNPALYVLLFDETHSTLARLLRRYSKHYWRLMQLDAGEAIDDRPAFVRISQFVNALTESAWASDSDFEFELLPQLLFHLLVQEDPEDRYPRSICKAFGSEPQSWGLGRPQDYVALHDKWYQPYRHDIIGNTLSADLLDYLRRDCSRLGIARAPDDNILNAYVLAESDGATGRFRTAVDVTDHKQGTLRSDLVNDVFRLLDLRHEIHERAVTHRIVHAATAMLSRALLLLDHVQLKPPSISLYFPTERGTCATAGDDCFLQYLIDRAKPLGDESHERESAHDLLRKLSERRLYRPLMVVPGHRARLLAPEHGLDGGTMREDETIARRIAAIVDSRLYSKFLLLISECVEQFLSHSLTEDEFLDELRRISRDGKQLARAANVVPKRVIIWTTPYKQLYKDPALAVLADRKRHVLDSLAPEMESSRDLTEAALFARAEAAIAHADDKYAGAWNIYVFVSDGLFYSGVYAKLASGHKCGPQPASASPNDHPHNDCLDTAKKIVAIALTTAYADWLTEREEREWERVGGENGSDTSAALDGDMANDDLQRLIRLFLAKWNEAKNLPAMSERLLEISTLQTDRYVHGDPSTAFNHFANCHDIGYKCDRDVNLIHKTPVDVFSARAGAAEFADVLMQTFGAPEKGLGESEFVELFQRHRRRPHLALMAQEERDKVAARDPIRFQVYLKRLLRSELFEIHEG